MKPLSSDHTAIQCLRQEELGLPPLKDFLGFRPDTLCNYHCVSCQQIKGKCAVSDDEFQRLLEQYGRPGAIFSISGGEPLLTEAHFERVCRQVAVGTRLGLFPSLFSNCHQLDFRQFERLLDAGLKQLTTAFYGVDAVTHDRFRGKAGSFDAQYSALKMIGRIRREFRHEFKLIVSVVIFRDNYRQLLDIVQMLGDIFGEEVDFIDFFPIKEYESLFLAADDVKFFKEQMLSDVETKLLRFQFPSAARKLREIFEGDPAHGVYGELPSRCYSSKTSLYVCGRERKIYPCGYMADYAERHPDEAVVLGEVGSDLDLDKIKALPLPICRKLCGPIVKGHNRRAQKAIDIMRRFADLKEVLAKPYAENILLLRLSEAYSAMRRGAGSQRG